MPTWKKSSSSSTTPMIMDQMVGPDQSGRRSLGPSPSKPYDRKMQRGESSRSHTALPEKPVAVASEAAMLESPAPAGLEVRRKEVGTMGPPILELGTWNSELGKRQWRKKKLDNTYSQDNDLGDRCVVVGFGVVLLLLVLVCWCGSWVRCGSFVLCSQPKRQASLCAGKGCRLRPPACLPGNFGVGVRVFGCVAGCGRAGDGGGLGGLGGWWASAAGGGYEGYPPGGEGSENMHGEC